MAEGQTPSFRRERQLIIETADHEDESELRATLLRQTLLSALICISKEL